MTFIVGIMFGGMFGFIVAGLMAASARASFEEDIMRKAAEYCKECQKKGRKK